MSNLQLIEELCYLVERQIRIIRNLSCQLEQMNCLEEADRQEITEAVEMFSTILGSDEVPDECPDYPEFPE